MIPVLRSLDAITTGYTVFEKNQVLTDTQLNSLASYLEDQDRLTRVYLLGVGVVCGLRVSLEGTEVRVTKGVGVTTDGDLLVLADDAAYDRFRPYDESAPRYEPLYPGGSMIPVFELVRQGVEDSRGVALSQFDSQTGKALTDMVALLLMESCVKDPDLCSGSDCDNLGQDAVHTTRLLLIEKASASLLLESLATPLRAATQLDDVVAHRPFVAATAATTAALAAPYHAACNTIHGNISAQLGKLYAACGAMLTDVLPVDPTTTWTSRLATINASFATNDVGIQYYYDFLKDLVETYNALHHLLFEDTTVCCPPIQAFPKHLLLGSVVPGAEANENRTGLYPSPLVSPTLERWWHAKWLAAKLNVMIQSFRVPSGTGARIRITPSRSEETSLEDRAIPYYYEVAGPLPIHEVWSFALACRGMAADNYSYSAADYGARGGAASPMTAQITGRPLLRIEGHLGQNITTVVAFLENEIRTKNLPIALRSVLLGVDKGKVAVKPPVHVTDLHLMQNVIRHSIANQLQDLTEFTGNFRDEVDRAVDRGEITNPPNVDVVSQVKAVAFAKSRIVSEKAGLAVQKLAAREPSWVSDVNDAITSAAEFKLELSRFAKTQFLAPVDALIAIPHAPWLDWLGDLIKDKDDKATERLLFNRFVQSHPGVEHVAGVVHGGTFVLVYDSTGTVVADFMLPYYLETPEQEEEEPTLPPPPVKPPWTLPPAIRVRPPLERVFGDRLDLVKTQVEKQAVFFDALRNPLLGGGTGGGVVEPRPPVGDLVLERYLADIQATEALLDNLHDKALDPALDPAALDAANDQIAAAETRLARAAADASTYVATTGLPVARGTDGYVALATVARTVTRLSDPAALDVAKTGLTSAADAATNADTQKVIGNITRVRRF